MNDVGSAHYGKDEVYEVYDLMTVSVYSCPTCNWQILPAGDRLV